MESWKLPRTPPPGRRSRYARPAALVEIGGLRLLTGPALELPGLIADGRRPAKTGGPGVAVSKPDAIHAVLLSHDQHAGNACLIFPACLTPPGDRR